jgi:polar amino acid transport system substrate-binding protein
MHQLRRVAAIIGLGACLALAATSAFADPLQTIKDRGAIVVGIDFTHPPYGMLDDKSQQTGTDYDMAQLLASDLGVKLQIIPVTGPNRIPFLLTNKADIVIASFTITDERKKVIGFSRPYAVEPILILAPASVSIKSAADLAGKSIAVARGNTADLELTNAIKDVPNVQVFRYVDEATARSAVSSGQQDILVGSLADDVTVQKANPGKHFELQWRLSEGDPLGIGLRKDDTTLQAWLNDWVTANFKNGKLNAVYQKYFGISLPDWIYSAN